MLMKQKKVKGFTLIEIVIVIAILSVLAMILIPSLVGYVKLAKKKATVVNGKTIYLAAMRCITTDTDANNSFYALNRTKKNAHNVSFEATPEGTITLMTKTYTNKAENINISSLTSKEIKPGDSLATEGNYHLIPVARVDGISHKKGGVGANPTHITNLLNTWTATNSAYQTFVNRLCAEDCMKPSKKDGNSFPLPMPYQDRLDGGGMPLIRWLIMYRYEDPDKVEIWAGDGYKCENGPAYRVYPNPASNYT